MKRFIEGNKRKLACLGIAILTIGSMSGCSSSKSTTTMSEAASQNISETYEVADQATSYESVDNSGAAESSTEMSSETDSNEYTTGDTPKISTETAYNRKIIKNAEMTLQTEHFTKSIEQMIDYLQQLGGYIEDSNIEGSNFYQQKQQLKTAYYKVRIPQQQFDTFVNKGGQFGIVTDLNCSTEDVTSQYIDAQLRVKTLQTRYDRLMALMEKSDDLTQLFKLEQEISNVSYEIEQYKGTLNHFDSLVDMGTLTIHVQEVKASGEVQEEPDTFGKQIHETFMESLDGVLVFLQGVVILLVGAMPILIVLVPLVWLAVYLIRKYGKKATGENETCKSDKQAVNKEEIDKESDR